MNKERINDFIDCYANGLQLTNEYRKILKQLIPQLITKYSKVFQEIPVEKDDYDKYIIKPVNEKYSLEDFFLNRLMSNVLIVKQSQVKNDNLKGAFLDEAHEITFNDDAINRQLDGRLTANPNDEKEFRNIARKKVIMHEFEHALQTQFKRNSAIYPFTKSNLKKVIEEISNLKNGKYANEINTYEELMSRPQEASMKSRVHNGLKNATYSTAISDNTNEIFNETEALEMVNAKVQNKRVFKDGSYMQIRNNESSNYKTTNYGDLAKILLGEKTTFIGMYLDPDKMFETFNARYDDIFQDAFNNDKSAWENFMEQINVIKSKSMEDAKDDHLKLQAVLAKCFERKVEKNIGIQDNQKLKRELNVFKNNTIWSDDKLVKNSFEHFQVLKSVREKLIEKDKEQATDTAQKDNQVESNKDDKKESNKTKFVKGFIQAYNDTETEYQYETRKENEEFDIERVQNIIKTKGLNRMLTMDLDGKWIGTPNDEDFKVEYSQKQVSAMVRLLKAAELLSNNKKLNPDGINYLEQFTSVPNIEYKLKQMHSDLKDENTYMFQLKQESKENRINGNIPQYEPTLRESEIIIQDLNKNAKEYINMERNLTMSAFGATAGIATGDPTNMALGAEAGHIRGSMKRISTNDIGKATINVPISKKIEVQAKETEEKTNIREGEELDDN